MRSTKQLTGKKVRVSMKEPVWFMPFFRVHHTGIVKGETAKLLILEFKTAGLRHKRKVWITKTEIYRIIEKN